MIVDVENKEEKNGDPKGSKFHRTKRRGEVIIALKSPNTWSHL